jgi:hypothetical protein
MPVHDLLRLPSLLFFRLLQTLLSRQPKGSQFRPSPYKSLTGSSGIAIMS